MSRAIALAARPFRIAPGEVLRGAIVYGCAMALIMAGDFLPL